ncbi:MAG: TolC family protein [Cytophagales bacterium]|nr:TolC family protein [Cytophagales bacterium]MDW8385096.1 TolC family protein [Flammeovirgaceae bacterium]
MQYVKRNYFLFIAGTCFFLLSENIKGQIKELSPDEFLMAIFQYHPVVKQAHLLSDNAKQELRLTRGFFDPKIELMYDDKFFKDKFYYSHWLSQLKIPVWIGDLKVGYERNKGAFLSPERDTDKGNGLGFMGISVPIGQGLIIDQRRATLLQAKIFQDIAETEKIKILNKILFSAQKDYWNWYFLYHQREKLDSAMLLAKFRYRAVVQSVLQGDAAPIDTVEALITLQKREIDLQNAIIDYQNASIILSGYLWDKHGNPLEINESIIPLLSPNLDFSPESLETLFEMAQKNHPELQKLRFKNAQLLVERKLSVENLKPVANVNYNLLTTTPPHTGMDGTYFSQNYKFGFDVSVPIFLRKERSKLQLTNLKIQQNNLEIQSTTRNIQNEISTTYNELLNLRNILNLQRIMIENHRKLVSAEIQKWLNGESSLFYVNVREGKLIEEQIKYYDLQHKLAKAYYTLLYAAGNIAESILNK